MSQKLFTKRWLIFTLATQCLLFTAITYTFTLPYELKSLKDDTPFSFTLHNDFDTDYKLYWIDQAGNYKYKATIGPDKYISFDSYETHAWVLQNQDDGSLIWFRIGVKPFITDGENYNLSEIKTTLDDILTTHESE